jgi:four helix bundle protein
LWAIADQLLRSGTSIGANVREAKASSSKRDYIKFFEIALKSANETGFWLELTIKAKSDIESETDVLLKESNEIASILAAGLMTMKDKTRY